ncbi:DUF3426 domain-containing protein [Thiomonas sp.]
MAQATRCPHCQTAFKVVRDQLLLREGWVRCGHCGQPFNAVDHLIDPAQEPPPAPAAEPEARAEPAPPPAPYPEPRTDTAPLAAGLRWSNISLDQPPYQGFLPLRAQPYDFTPRPAAADAPVRDDDAWPQHAPSPEGDRAAPAPQADELPPQADLDAAPLSEFHLEDALNYRFENIDPLENLAPGGATTAQAEPEFLRKARRQVFWDGTPARAALGVISLLLLLVLATQSALHWRDDLAQQWPASRPWLQQLCAMTTGCELAAPRDLHALVIDSSALSPSASGLQLSVLLRNRADRSVAWPALELTLTDAQGVTLQRKVVQAAQYLPTAAATDQTLREGLAAGQQVQLLLHVEVSGPAPAGYKLVLFYP